MNRILLVAAATILTSCGALTPSKPNPPAELPKPKISEGLKQPCDPLPDLEVAPGTKDMRKDLLNNRAAAALVHADCSDKHLGVLEAVGVTPAERSKIRRLRADQLLKELRTLPSNTNTGEPQ